VLAAGEESAPVDVQQRFDTIVQSIDTGIQSLKPGVHGYEIDEVVRNHITNA
jgi:Xaa-Pro aminopeptidase